MTLDQLCNRASVALHTAKNFIGDIAPMATGYATFRNIRAIHQTQDIDLGQVNSESSEAFNKWRKGNEFMQHLLVPAAYIISSAPLLGSYLLMDLNSADIPDYAMAAIGTLGLLSVNNSISGYITNQVRNIPNEPNLGSSHSLKYY